MRRRSSRFQLSHSSPPNTILRSSSITSAHKPFTKSNNKSIEEDNTIAKSIISLLKSEKDPDRILSICEPILTSSRRHSIPHLHRLALSIAVSALTTSNSVSTVHSLLSPLPIHHAIVLYGEADMIDDALSTFSSYIRSVRYHNHSSSITRSFNALLFACIVSNNHKLIPTLFRDHCSRGAVPDLTTYNTLLKSYCQSGSSLSVYSVFDEMSKKKVKPNLTSFTIALTGLYCDEKLQHIDRLLVLMKKHGCHPGLSIYNVRIKCLCKLGRVDEAKDLLYKEMRQRGMKPNWVTYDHLILGYCSAGDLEMAKSIFKEMIKKGYLPGSGSCYFTLIHYLCKAGDFEYALELCRECTDQKDWVPHFSIMKDLVLGLVGVDKINDALELVDKVKNKFPKDACRWKEVDQVLASLQLCH